jgi:hypothetical protein
MVQVHVLARVWGFESLLRHHFFLSVMYCDLRAAKTARDNLAAFNSSSEHSLRAWLCSIHGEMSSDSSSPTRVHACCSPYYHFFFPSGRFSVRSALAAIIRAS